MVLIKIGNITTHEKIDKLIFITICVKRTKRLG